MKISLYVNEQKIEREVQEHRTLLEFLRDELNLTGTKEGCGNGECGACTVLINNIPIRSCLVLAVEANGQRITTIEGLAKNGELDKIQKVFIETGAVQCGFCTPGFIMATKALLVKNPKPDLKQIKQAIGGHLCRCTGYASIYEAIAKIANKKLV